MQILWQGYLGWMRQAYRRRIVSFGYCHVVYSDTRASFSYRISIAHHCRSIVSEQFLLFSLTLLRHHSLCILISSITPSEKMLPSVTVVLGGKQGNAARQGDSCTVSRSIAKIVVSRKGLTHMRVCAMMFYCSHHLFTTWACSHTTSTCSLCNLATRTNKQTNMK